MHKKIFVILIFLIALTSKAQEKDFNINEFFPIENSHSYIEFSIKYMGYAMVKGRFEKFNGTFKYDESDINETSVSLSITANSIDTDNNRRDDDLKSENWFDVEEYPTITFVSKKVRSTESGFEIIGNLTIKAITKEVVVKMNQDSGILKDIRGDFQVIFSGNTIIDRTEFGVEGKRWSAIKEGISGVANEVKIEVSILCKQMNISNLKNRVQNVTHPSGKIYKVISDNGIEDGLKIFDEMKLDTEIILNPNTLNIVGKILLKEGKTKEALKVFNKNIETFPEESNLYNSYAEALVTSGNLKEAKIYYQKALERNDDNQNASEILRHLR